MCQQPKFGANRDASAGGMRHDNRCDRHRSEGALTRVPTTSRSVELTAACLNCVALS